MTFSMSRLRIQGCEKGFKRLVELRAGVWLAQESHALDKQRLHLSGHEIPCRVEHAQRRANPDGLASQLTPAEDRGFEIDVGHQNVDVLRGLQDDQRLIDVAG